MRALEADAATLAARADAAQRADTAYRIARERYQAGGISHLALLDAQRQALDATRARLDAQGARLSDTAALWQALGGAPITTAADDAAVAAPELARPSSPASALPR